MKLYEWIRAHNMTYESFAELVGAKDNSVVHKWCMAGAVPRRSMMQRIFEITGGQVTPNDFFDLSGSPGKEGGAS